MAGIIRIGRDTAMSCVQLSIEHCEGGNIRPEDVTIVMRRMGIGLVAREPASWDEGCGVITPIGCGYHSNVSRRPQPGIEYCGFKADAEGRVCFLWDDKLLEARSGRYRGHLSICGRPIGCLDFQLGDKIKVGSSTAVSADCCPPARC